MSHKPYLPPQQAHPAALTIPVYAWPKCIWAKCSLPEIPQHYLLQLKNIHVLVHATKPGLQAGVPDCLQAARRWNDLPHLHECFPNGRPAPLSSLQDAQTVLRITSEA